MKERRREKERRRREDWQMEEGDEKR